MSKEITVAWIAGLFEGEGTFCINKESYSKGVSITSTDLDVLEKVNGVFGGRIATISRKHTKKHWKQAYVWTLGIKASILFTYLILPYLGERRKKRAEQFIQFYNNKEDSKVSLKVKSLKLNEEISKLYEEGKTHQQIASLLGIERSTVSKRLGNMVDVV